ncbi:MAG: FadR family transcriptional regulator, partial [Candidatus Marinimicrobia bacterium]|nr:FadR family transcriptional regulator [Candidatus Neomarinimicrobiota bacterium]
MRVQITSSKLKPGDKLPTEQKLVEAYGVSRTVVREAIAALRADGLMESRHGVGVFVLVPPKKSDDFRFLGEDPGRASSVVETLELRAAVEIEAAMIAAQRRSPGQDAR